MMSGGRISFPHRVSACDDLVSVSKFNSYRVHFAPRGHAAQMPLPFTENRLPEPYIGKWHHTAVIGKLSSMTLNVCLASLSTISDAHFMASAQLRNGPIPLAGRTAFPGDVCRTIHWVFSIPLTYHKSHTNQR